jgi:L-iditol 2-dehydrogenase
MKVLRYYQPGKIEIEDQPEPEIKPGEILVKVSACGVCATDIKTYQRGHPKIQPGAVLGHEISGVVVKTNQVDQWQVGARVAVAPYCPCFQCEQCERENYTQCKSLMDEAVDPGGFAEFVRVPQRIVKYGLVELPDTLSLEEGSLAEPVACCLHSLIALDYQEKDTLLIIGDGPMGLLQAETARALGIQKIILSGAIPERLARAALVADVVIDSTKEDVGSVVQKVSPGGAQKVLVSVGNTEVAGLAFDCVQKGGSINLFAGLPKDARLMVNPAQIHYDEIRVLGTFGFNPSHFEKAVFLLAQRKINLTGIITAKAPLEQAKQTFKDVAEFRGIRSIITFS